MRTHNSVLTGKTRKMSLTSYEPAAKRACIDADNDEHKEMAINDVQMDTNTATILEWLNGDVLRIVFNNLSIEDILGSLTVSEKWHNVMLKYLKDSRYCFEYYFLPRLHFVPRLLGLVSATDVCNKRTTPFNMSHGDWQTFQSKIKDLGPAIVSIVLDCLNEDSLRIITENCPHLKEIMLVGMTAHPAHGPHSSFDQHGVLIPQQCQLLSITGEIQELLKVLQLKRAMFVDCQTLTDEHIGEFIKSSDSLEELVVCRNSSVTGYCLYSLNQKKKNNLKSLRLVTCSLESHYLDSVADHLTNLKVLDLSKNPSRLLENVHQLLAKTPNLEYLYLNYYAASDVGNDLANSLRGLRRLKHFSLCWNDNLCDEWLEAVAAGCPDLQTLDMEVKCTASATVTAGAIIALCRSARDLAHLGLAGHGDVTDAHVATIIASCSKLESIDLRGCARMLEGPEALGALAAPQRQNRPLRLRLARTSAERRQMQAPPGLIFDFVDAPRLFRMM